jgi:hypothetical protein
MNDDTLTIGGMDGAYGVISQATGATLSSNTILVSNASTASTNVGISFDTEDQLDKHAMCKFTVDHKVTDAELLKLKEVAPDYAKEIKENIARNLARDISHKITYTKKHDKDTDVHHFIGRVWVFTEEELKHILGIR